ncbi:hypothetical protein Q0Z83_060060 [Actinoplanes sichuanensis]|uniref:Uncharacterized protein n=1 Tax=Actinoplanes sichuanensis TaxID=512349 RepID=A0ABW4A7H5_9ACTN|nr:hypothetical protein [Actinoplanes sichuanensis]BEL07815.1 hypothetical protein Q0Z83_060060 [Actinoplanes sichuanensis]
MTERLASRIGRRGAALLFFTLLDTVYCIGLLTAPEPLVPFYAWMAEIAPLGVWAVGWGGVGLVCLVYAFRTYDTMAFMAAVALKVAWGMLSLFGWLAGQVDRGYVSAVIWLGFAAFVFLIAGGIPAAPTRPAGRRWAWTRS